MFILWATDLNLDRACHSPKLFRETLFFTFHVFVLFWWFSEQALNINCQYYKGCILCLKPRTYFHVCPQMASLKKYPSTLDMLEHNFNMAWSKLTPTKLDLRREKHLERAGIKPRSLCSSCDHSNRLTMVFRATWAVLLSATIMFLSHLILFSTIVLLFSK